MDKQKLRVFLFSNFPLKYLEKTILRKKYDNSINKEKITTKLVGKKKCKNLVSL